MKLMTKKIIKNLPPMEAIYGKARDETLVPARFFTLTSHLTWYLIAYCESKDIAGEPILYGYIVGDDNDFGCFSITELENLRLSMGLGVERDRLWNPKTTLADVLKREGEEM